VPRECVCVSLTHSLSHIGCLLLNRFLKFAECLASDPVAFSPQLRQRMKTKRQDWVFPKKKLKDLKVSSL
jgi:hypothetical protein